MSADSELLREHVERGSDEAFRTLVERHSGMVHGAAMRIVQDEHLAEEVTQAVFLILARKGARLRRGTVLAGWLHRTARFVALEALRGEQRRRQKLEHFAQMNDSPLSASVWEQIAPLLEEAMSRLGARDRDVVVLRYLEEKSFAQVASVIGISEGAVKMRAGRALEKLRAAFARRGVAVPAAALLAAFSAHGASIAPAGLSAGAVAAALAPEAAANASLGSLVTGALKIMAWNKIKSVAVACAIALLLAGGVMVVLEQPGQRAVARPVFVASLAPMAGEWEGSFESRGDGLAQPVRQAAVLSIRTAQEGRSCEIEMRVSDADRLPAVYRFTHTLKESGDRIFTVDDPAIRRVAGDGVITESLGDSCTGERRVAFRAPHSNRGGFTDCRWVCRGDQLTIIRHDTIAGSNRSSQRQADLKLRRRTVTNAVP
ncbi:MAG TPA: sigma-70 family RNA polymerase sigma factor [Verrucomicrobiae bacterium]